MVFSLKGSEFLEIKAVEFASIEIKRLSIPSNSSDLFRIQLVPSSLISKTDSISFWLLENAGFSVDFPSDLLIDIEKPADFTSKTPISIIYFYLKSGLHAIFPEI